MRKDMAFKTKLCDSNTKLICSYRWLTNKENELKTIHSLLLKHKIDENGYSQLMIAVKQLSTFN